MSIEIKWLDICIEDWIKLVGEWGNGYDVTYIDLCSFYVKEVINYNFYI